MRSLSYIAWLTLRGVARLDAARESKCVRAVRARRGGVQRESSTERAAAASGGPRCVASQENVSELWYYGTYDQLHQVLYELRSLEVCKRERRP